MVLNRFFLSNYMKKYYLFYNELIDHYYLDCGVFDRNRVDLGVCKDFFGLEKKLKENLYLHRKSLMHVNKNFPLKYRQNLKEFFKNSRVKVSFEYQQV